MTNPFPDVMIDLETGGLNPTTAPIIQIAGVKFNLKTGDVSPEFFNRCLQVPPFRQWDLDTYAWWTRDKRALLQDIQSRAEDPKLVLKEFVDWVGFDAPVLWAKPTTFEYPFLQFYCHDLNEPFPFHFRTATDCRSYIKGLAFPDEPISDKDIEFKGEAHNALFDTIHQVRWMLANQEKFGRAREEVAA